MAEPSVSLLADRGAAAVETEFFRSSEFLEAEGTTHTLMFERGSSRAALPLIVREIPGAGGLLDASSPYSYPGARVEGEPLDPASFDLASSGLLSVFVRDRLGAPPALVGGTARSLVQIADPALPRKSRMSDRQQIRKNEAAGYLLSSTEGPSTSPRQHRGFHSVYAETMAVVDASSRYMFGLDYFERLLRSPLTRLFEVHGPDGDLAAAAIAVRSDGYLHYYLSGTADAHRRRAPSKNLIVAVTQHAAELGLPMNLGGGITSGDGLEEFKRGFANREETFWTHELICDPSSYAELTGGRRSSRFFPLYRAPDED